MHFIGLSQLSLFCRGWSVNLTSKGFESGSKYLVIDILPRYLSQKWHRAEIIHFIQRKQSKRELEIVEDSQGNYRTSSMVWSLNPTSYGTFWANPCMGGHKVPLPTYFSDARKIMISEIVYHSKLRLYAKTLSHNFCSSDIIVAPNNKYHEIA